MIRFILLLTLSATHFLTVAQNKTEFYGRVGSGLFFFSGKSAVKEQGIVFFSNDMSAFRSSYGKTPGFSITAGGSMKKLFRSNWLLETSIDFQSLSATSAINQVSIMSSSLSSLAFGEPATGTARYRANFISLAPSFGKRIGKGSKTLDITAGPELAVLLNSQQKLEYKSANTQGNRTGDIDPPSRGLDLRIQLQAMLRIKKLGFFAGYAKGCSNYYTGEEAGYSKAFSNFMKLGLTYQLK